MLNIEDFEVDNKSIIEQARIDILKKHKNSSVRELAAEFKRLKAMKEETEELLKRINGAYGMLACEFIPEAMEREGLQSPVKFDGIGRISLTADLFVSVIPGRKEGLFEWLEMNNLGSLVQPTLNASTLKAFVKGRLMNGGDVPEGFVNITPVTRASILK